MWSERGNCPLTGKPLASMSQDIFTRAVNYSGVLFWYIFSLLGVSVLKYIAKTTK